MSHLYEYKMEKNNYSLCEIKTLNVQRRNHTVTTRHSVHSKLVSGREQGRILSWYFRTISPWIVLYIQGQWQVLQLDDVSINFYKIEMENYSNNIIDWIHLLVLLRL